MLFYSFWLLVTAFISMAYTNILQSHVVVPGIRYGDMSFEDMVEKDYVFESVQWQWMESVTMWGRHEAQTAMGIRERELSHRVSGRRKFLMLDSELGEFVNYYSETRKTALVDTSGEKDLYKLISKVTGQDVVVGKDSFFNVPLWWAFSHVERAPLWAKSVETLMEAGLTAYFVELCEAKIRGAILMGSGHKVPAIMPYARITVRLEERQSEGVNASLSDALISECFVIFLYGNTLAIILFLVEKLTRVCILSVRRAVEQEIYRVMCASQISIP